MPIKLRKFFVILRRFDLVLPTFWIGSLGLFLWLLFAVLKPPLKQALVALESQYHQILLRGSAQRLNRLTKGFVRSGEHLEHTLGQVLQKHSALSFEKSVRLLVAELRRRTNVHAISLRYGEHLLHVVHFNTSLPLVWSAWARQERRQVPQWLKQQTKFSVQYGVFQDNSKTHTAQSLGAHRIWAFYDRDGQCLWRGALPAELWAHRVKESPAWVASAAKVQAQLCVDGPFTFFGGGKGVAFTYPFKLFSKEKAEKKAGFVFYGTHKALARALLGEHHKAFTYIHLLDRKGKCILDAQKENVQLHSDVLPVRAQPYSASLKAKQGFHEKAVLSGMFADFAHSTHAVSSDFFQGVKIVARFSVHTFALLWHRLKGRMFWSAMLVLVLFSLIVYRLAHAASAPILLASKRLQDVQRMVLKVPDKKRFFLSDIQSMMDALRGVIHGLSAFNKLVPAPVAAEVLEKNEEAHLEAKKRNITIFFSDIAGFTTIAESMSPEDLAAHLARYFSAMEGVITQTEGVIDKYIGDAIMALWNAPRSDSLHGMHACEAALLSAQRLKTLNQSWSAEGKTVLKVRIGLATGPVVVGNMGSEKRFQYTALGDTVNLASRLEGLSKVYGTEILTNEGTFLEARNTYLFRLVDKVAVKGKTQGVRVYELLCRKSVLKDCEEHPLESLAHDSEKAFMFYERGAFQKAFFAYQNIEKRHGDSVAKVMKERCLRFLNTPPRGWDGAWSALEK